MFRTSLMKYGSADTTMIARARSSRNTFKQTAVPCACDVIDMIYRLVPIRIRNPTSLTLKASAGRCRLRLSPSCTSTLPIVMCHPPPPTLPPKPLSLCSDLLQTPTIRDNG